MSAEARALVQLIAAIVICGLLGTAVAYFVALWLLPPNQPLLGALVGLICGGGGALVGEFWLFRRWAAR